MGRHSDRPRALAPGRGKWSEDTLLPDGKAISPLSAGRCIIEHCRTAVFVRGVCQAISDLQKRAAGGPIRILYAGTGPFAPLFLCQTPYFTPAEIRFTLLDIHEVSLDCLRTIVRHLDIGDYVEAFVLADVSTYSPALSQSPDGRFELVACEVMQRALQKEPQVAVTENLSRHLAAGGILIPQQVDVSLCLLNPDHEHRSLAEMEHEQETALFRKRYGTTNLISLRSDNIPIFGADGESLLCHVELPDFAPRRLLLYYLTDITVYKNHVIGEYDCSLTLPTPAKTDIPPTPGMRLEAVYKKGEMPGIQLRIRR
jgi:hypothetical protein